MKTFSVSDSDLQLLSAIKPFMSNKSQGLLDLVITVMNIFKPGTPDEKINFEALNTLLTMVHQSTEAKKNSQIIETDDYEDISVKKPNELEELLNIIAENENEIEQYD